MAQNNAKRDESNALELTNHLIVQPSSIPSRLGIWSLTFVLLSECKIPIPIIWSRRHLSWTIGRKGSVSWTIARKGSEHHRRRELGRGFGIHLDCHNFCQSCVADRIVPCTCVTSLASFLYQFCAQVFGSRWLSRRYHHVKCMNILAILVPLGRRF